MANDLVPIHSYPDQDGSKLVVLREDQLLAVQLAQVRSRRIVPFLWIIIVLALILGAMSAWIVKPQSRGFIGCRDGHWVADVEWGPAGHGWNGKSVMMLPENNPCAGT